MPQDEDLSAFVDRFVYRPWLRYVRSLNSKRELINRARHNKKLCVTTRLSLDEIRVMQREAAQVPYPDELVEDLVCCVRLPWSGKGFTLAIANYSNW